MVSSASSWLGASSNARRKARIASSLRPPCAYATPSAIHASASLESRAQARCATSSARRSWPARPSLKFEVSRTRRKQQVVSDRLHSEQIAQGLAFEQFHDDERVAVVLVDVVDGADVRMIQRGCGPRFPAKALQCMRIGADLLGEELHGHQARQLGVRRFEHDAHAAAAQCVENPVV
jgi:hypothetical protein